MIRLLQGDCREVLRTLPDGSVHCIITSPPYLGLREYGTATWEGGSSSCEHVVGEIRTGLGMAALGEKYRGGGKKASDPKPMFAKGECPNCGAIRVDKQIGLEPSPDAYVAEMVSLFRELWRVLRYDGTIWLNLGDAYASNGGHSAQGVSSARVSRANVDLQNSVRGFRPGLQADGLKTKDLMMMPARVALALQADGWWLRKDIIWFKPNPMPESATDRPTSSHEHVFLLAKSGSSTFWTHRDKSGVRRAPDPDYRWINRQTGEERDTDPGNNLLWRKVNLWKGHDYFFDGEAVREAGESGPSDQKKMAEGLDRIGGKHKTLDDPLARASAATNMGRKRSVGEPGTRNVRDVWTIATAPFPEAHFATFPPELAERCIKAGTSERGCCASCGAPWARSIIKGEPDMAHRLASGASADGEYRGQSTKGHDAAGVQNASDVKRRILEGMREKMYDWRPTCGCGTEIVPCTVLDPFAGAFTTCLVADRLGRNTIGIELNPQYVEIGRRRLQSDAGFFADLEVQTTVSSQTPGDVPLDAKPASPELD